MTDDAGAENVEEAEALEYGAVVSWSAGEQKVLHVERERWFETAAEMAADDWSMCVDLTAVDYLGYSQPRPAAPAGLTLERFEVVASLLSMPRRERVRLRAQVPESDPTIASLYEIYPGTDFLEREVFDLMGITFEGHPDLSRILLPEDWEGHPLRKDFAVGTIPVQFKQPDAS